MVARNNTQRECECLYSYASVVTQKMRRNFTPSATSHRESSMTCALQLLRAARSEKKERKGKKSNFNETKYVAKGIELRVVKQSNNFSGLGLAFRTWNFHHECSPWLKAFLPSAARERQASGIGRGFFPRTYFFIVQHDAYHQPTNQPTPSARPYALFIRGWSSPPNIHRP